jgi:hypothetical protein
MRDMKTALLREMVPCVPSTYTPDAHLNTCGHQRGPREPTRAQVRPSSSEANTCVPQRLLRADGFRADARRAASGSTINQSSGQMVGLSHGKRAQKNCSIVG